jgi:hypothetical protein
MKDIILFLILAMSSPAGTLYIDFTTSSGPAPASGSFKYDPLVGFSEFIVIWGGDIFDLTSAANAPTLSAGSTGCAGRASTQQYGFIINSETALGCTPSYAWDGSFDGTGFTSFTFALSVLANADSIGQTQFVGQHQTPPNAHGTWSLSETAVPEPGSLTYMLLASLTIVGKRCWKRKIPEQSINAVLKHCRTDSISAQ